MNATDTKFRSRCGASGTISRYSIAPGGTLTLQGSTTIGTSGAVGAVDARLSPMDGSCTSMKARSAPSASSLCTTAT